MKAPKAPTPPDPMATAAANQQGNIQTAIANNYMSNPNVNGPFGQSRTTQTGTRSITDAQGNEIEVPTWTVDQTLSDAEQKNYDMSNRVGLRAGDLGLELMNNINTDRIDLERMTGAGAPVELERMSGNYDQYRNRAEQALRQRYQPDINTQYEAERTRMANQGVDMGSESFQHGMDNANRARNDANLAIIGQAGQESDRAFGQDLSRVSLNNQTALSDNDRSFAQRMAEINQHNTAAFAGNNQTLNQLTALMGQQQVTAPQFQAYQGGNVAGTSVGGYINQGYQQQQQNYQNQSKNHNAMLGGLGGLFGTMAGGPIGGAVGSSIGGLF